ncbi:MAG: hypothetical protein QF724_07415 [Planctomycetota bacterium]|nr:hypothetical protein [Planctomycetota bacterium]
MSTQPIRDRPASNRNPAAPLACFGFLLLAACRGPGSTSELALGTSLFGLSSPGLGVAVSQVFARDEYDAWALELKAAHQAQLSSGPPANGVDAWTQFQLGLSRRTVICDDAHHWVRGCGVAWFRAPAGAVGDDPPGDYAALYASLGLEHSLGWGGLSLEPEVSLLSAFREGHGGGAHLVPQFNLHLIWRF